MRFAIATVLFTASLAAAQTATSAAAPAASSCQAQNIVDTCTDQYNRALKTCGGQDYMCLCDNWTNLLSCYNNCPNDPNKSPAQNSVTQYCAIAAPLSASSIAAAKTRSSVSQDATSAATQTATKTAVVTGLGAGTASATSAAKTGAADALAVPAGMVAALIGIVGFL